MPRYQTKLIADFATGYTKAREPWLSPADSFPTLLDARVEKGVLKKRAGITELADTGAGNPIMGIYHAMTYGHPTILVADTKRLYSYDPWTEALTDLAGSDIFTGTNRDFFWFQVWRDKVYLCNGVDSIYVYDEYAGTLAALDTEGDSSTDITIQSCKMIFRFKSRLIFISPVVDGTWYPRRMYYTDVNLTTVLSTNWVDGDFEDIPVGGCYINDEPTIFCHERFIAKVAYTRNTDTPFAFDKAWQDNGALGPPLAPTTGRRALVVGHDHFFWWDGYQAEKADLPVRGFVGDIANVYAWFLQATARRDEPIIYLAYPNSGSTANDRILEFNHLENNFTIHRIAAHCLCATSGHVSTSHDDLDDLLGDDGDTAPTISNLDVIRHPTYGPMVFIGGSTGKLYLMNYGTTDDGTTISSQVKSIQFNPFANIGRKVKFGKLRVLVTTDNAKSCTVKLYKDQGSTAYKTITLSAAGSGDQHWEILHPDGEVGDWHMVELTGDIPEIHAWEIDVAPAGRLEGS